MRQRKCRADVFLNLLYRIPVPEGNLALVVEVKTSVIEINCAKQPEAVTDIALGVNKPRCVLINSYPGR